MVSILHNSTILLAPPLNSAHQGPGPNTWTASRFTNSYSSFATIHLENSPFLFPPKLTKHHCSHYNPLPFRHPLHLSLKTLALPTY